MAGKAAVLQSDVQYDYVNGKRVKVYSFDYAIELLGVSKPTFYDWVKRKKIMTGTKDTGVIGEKPTRIVTDAEIKRVKALMKQGWGRAKGRP